MSITVREEPANHFQISIGGRFTSDAYRSFLEAIDWVDPASKSITFDLHATEYMEGSALGLLLLARREFPHKNTILKVNNDSDIDEILELAHFDRLFAIKRV